MLGNPRSMLRCTTGADDAICCGIRIRELPTPMRLIAWMRREVGRPVCWLGGREGLDISRVGCRAAGGVIYGTVMIVEQKRL